MKAPRINQEKMILDTEEFLNLAPTRDVYLSLIASTDMIMSEVLIIRRALTTDSPAIRSELNRWDEEYEAFSSRRKYYENEIKLGDDESIIDAAMFYGDYPSMPPSLGRFPKQPDAGTPWSLINSISSISSRIQSGHVRQAITKGYLTSVVSNFWSDLNARITRLKSIHSTLEGDGDSPVNDGGVVFGFWPLVAIGIGLIGSAMAGAAGYASVKSSSAHDYIDGGASIKKSAKTFGIGAVVGLSIAVLIVSRRP